MSVRLLCGATPATAVVAMPKSRIDTQPTFDTITLARLTSRWTRPSGRPLASVSSWA